jgi:hypothetical protein
MLSVLRISCALGIAAIAWPAAAAPFLEQTANWTVTAFSTSCVGFNRPPAEYNQSPWNSLTLTAPKTGGVLIAAMFWPGVIEDGKAYHLKIHTEGHKVHDIDAEGGSGIGLRSIAAVPDEVLKELTAADMVTVGASGVPVQLGFEMTHLADVLVLLEQCRATLAQ